VKKTDLIKNELYAVQVTKHGPIPSYSSGSRYIVCARYIGMTTKKTSYGNYPYPSFTVVESPQEYKGPKTLNLDNCAHVKMLWSQWQKTNHTSSVPEKALLEEADSNRDKLDAIFASAAFAIKAEEMERLVWFLRTIDIEAGLAAVTTDGAEKEPAIFIRSRSAETLMDLVRKIGLYNLTEA
jgi:hypothetical protein